MSGRARVDVFLVPGELTIHTTPTNVKTILGSCVAVCLWDEVRHIGGVNHFLLPVPNPQDVADNRFGSIATPRLIQALCRRGATTSALRAAVVGGGKPVRALSDTTVSDDNVAVAQRILAQFGIRVVRQETGGAYGRKLLFNTHTGGLLIRLLHGCPNEGGASRP